MSSATQTYSASRIASFPLPGAHEEITIDLAEAINAEGDSET
jgi:hypothetical protein